MAVKGNPVTRLLYIFDLDGTLADTTHRQPLIDRANIDDERAWGAYYKECKLDSPIIPTIQTARMLSLSADIWIWSGRSDVVRDDTWWWLNQHAPFLAGPDQVLLMRKAGDKTPDTELKKDWYMNMLPSDQDRLVGVFEDRNRMAEMWRSMGVTCFHVADGNF